MTIASLVYSSISLIDPPPSIVITSIHTFLMEAFTIQYKDGRTARPPETRTPLLLVDQGTLSSNSLETGTPSHTIPVPTKRSPRILNTETTSSLVHLVQGIPYVHGRIMRVLDDQRVRPTTSRATKSPIRASHALGIEVRYNLSAGGSGKKEKSWSIERPVEIRSVRLSAVL